jgi:MFS family permease
MNFGFKKLSVAGIALTTTGTFIMSLLNTDSSYLFHMLPAFLVLATGFGISFVAITVAATSGIPGEEAGLASGLINTSQQIGGALGLAILAVVAATATNAALAAGVSAEQASMAGYQRAFFTASTLMFTALLIAIFVIQETKNSKPHHAPVSH